MKWYTVTWRGTAEMTAWILADSPDNARMRAEEGRYEDASDIAFVQGRPYTMKVRVAPGPPSEHDLP